MTLKRATLFNPAGVTGTARVASHLLVTRSRWWHQWFRSPSEPGQRQTQAASPAELDRPAKRSKTGFLDLPPELRIQVYEYVAYATSITPRYARDQSVPSPALLSVSRQIQKEYKPVLLSLADITFSISAFDFGRPLTHIRVHRKLLRSNERLVAEFVMVDLSKRTDAGHYDLMDYYEQRQDVWAMRNMIENGAMHRFGLTWRLSITWTAERCPPVSSRSDVLGWYIRELQWHHWADEVVDFDRLRMLGLFEHELDGIQAKQEYETLEVETSTTPEV